MNWKKGNPAKEGWYLVAYCDEEKKKTRAIRCFWRNKPKKVYYVENGVTKFRYKGNAGWSKNNLQGRKPIAYAEIPSVDEMMKGIEEQ